MRAKRLVLIAGIFMITFCPQVFAGTVVDHSIYAELLGKYVKNGLVDYRGFKDEEQRLNTYLNMLEKVDSSKLSRNEQFAFYINAYNAWTIKLILSKYPGVASIKDLGSIFRSPWKKKFVRLDGKMLTLDNIEHGILRPRYRDPRVHVAVNCASKSCPPLSSEPFTGADLEDQLENATIRFINDTTRNRLEGTTLYVSRVFKWFAEDFNHDITDFFLKYARGTLKQRLQKNADSLTIKYLDYDWSLNGK